jgi:hypothetical protein
MMSALAVSFFIIFLLLLTSFIILSIHSSNKSLFTHPDEVCLQIKKLYNLQTKKCLQFTYKNKKIKKILQGW